MAAVLPSDKSSITIIVRARNMSENTDIVADPNLPCVLIGCDNPADASVAKYKFTVSEKL
jgi:hypothetical protein